MNAEAMVTFGPLATAIALWFSGLRREEELFFRGNGDLLSVHLRHQDAGEWEVFILETVVHIRRARKGFHIESGNGSAMVIDYDNEDYLTPHLIETLARRLGLIAVERNPSKTRREDGYVSA